jgi:Fur family transcriptional regulator, peroxide stress response regulator
MLIPVRDSSARGGISGGFNGSCRNLWMPQLVLIMARPIQNGLKIIIDNIYSYMITFLISVAAPTIHKYRKLGFKLTPQRLAILEFLEGNKGHPSADDIFQAVSKKYPTMSFATVYNTLEALRQRGRVRELTTDPGKKRFDPNTEPHHHLVCVRCRRTFDIHREFDLRLSSAEHRDFKIIGSHIEFYGLCSQCRGKTDSRSRIRKGTTGDEQ